MSGFLVHRGATVLCLHGGTAQPVVVNPRVKVSDQQIVTQTSSYTIAACSLTTVPPGTTFCATATWTSGATRVKAGGVPVVLQDSQATCVNTGTGLNITVTQTRVKGT